MEKEEGFDGKAYDDARVAPPCGCLDGLCLGLHGPACKHYRFTPCPECGTKAVCGDFGAHCFDCGWYWDIEEQSG